MDVGTIVDRRFEIVARLAIGGFAVVYRAIDLRTGAEVALKLLRPELASDISLVARFEREGEILVALNAPNTVKLVARGRTAQGARYLALELLRGEGLDARLHDEGRLPWRRALAFARETCAALAEAHALGIVHRDLKPANLFLTRSFDDLAEHVTVIDFGVATRFADDQRDDRDAADSDVALERAELTRVGQAVGTVDYMAPEQLVGSTCDPRSDIYTLGVVAYELIVGARPFADERGAAALISAVLTQDPPPASARVDVPPAVDAVLARCLARDPDDRFATVAELAVAIDHALAAGDDLTDQVIRLADGSIDEPFELAPVMTPARDAAGSGGELQRVAVSATTTTLIVERPIDATTDASAGRLARGSIAPPLAPTVPGRRARTTTLPPATGVALARRPSCRGRVALAAAVVSTLAVGLLTALL